MRCSVIAGIGWNLIEINGDYWHANPLQYNANEAISYPKGIKKASDVWEQDSRKIRYAESRGFQIIVLWESQIKNQEHIGILEKIK